MALALAGVLAAPVAFGAEEVSAPAGGAASKYTYTKDIAPLIESRCGECHRPNGIAPFSMVDYRQVRGWGKMIKEVTSEGRMPPWHADKHIGKWSNDRSLTDEQKQMVAAWVDSGMPQGNPADLKTSEAVNRSEWRIGEPDVIFEMPEGASVNPTGVVPYRYFETKTNFKEDVWVSAMECLPGNPKVVHHIIMFVSDPKHPLNFRSEEVGEESTGGFLDAFAPGGVPQILPPGQARKIPAGASLLWQVHYTPTGKLENDRSRFGIKFAKGPITQQMMTGNCINHDFEIPARADNYMIEAYLPFKAPVTIMSLAPHAHYRGKSFDYYMVYPDGREEQVLSVPKYDFNWQTTYNFEKPLEVPAGAKMHVIAHFDNSSANPYNPDPEKAVRWGDQTWEEMMIGFFHYARPVNVQVSDSGVQIQKSETSGD
jgi:mono/diheme cytochrome c family protein